MRMMKTLVAIGLSTLAISAMAQELKITNNTSFFSTSKINSTPFCSSMFGEWGITKPHSMNTVSELHMKQACTFFKTNCKADIYMTDNCSGNVVGTVYFDIYKGTKSVKVNDPRFQLVSALNSFEFVINEVK